MKKYLLFFLIGLFLQLGSSPISYAEEYITGTIIATPSVKSSTDPILVETENGEKIFVDIGERNLIPGEETLFLEGEKIVLLKIKNSQQGENIFLSERYRLSALIGFIVFFFILTLSITKGKGIFAFGGLIISIIIIIKGLIPSLIDGVSPLLAGGITSTLIILTSFYSAHGFSWVTTLSIISTFFTLTFAFILGKFAIILANLSGMGSEASIVAQMGELYHLNFEGIFLLGVILGTLGVLDDVTTSQIATVQEIKRANTNLGMQELWTRSMRVGHHHIFSLINTLALAYIGASLPLFLLLFYGATPFWVAFNSEMFAEELIRTLIGSSAILFAVPLSSILGAWFFSRYNITLSKAIHTCSHSHV